MTIKKSEEQASKEKKKRKLALQKKYSQRITIARQGREAFLQKDYVNAAKKYNEYLAILAELNDLEDVYQLSPAMFDSKTQVTEMLLISHIYWELARIHEMTPKLQKSFAKALSQFIKFTVNQPYQVLNAEMLRKYIKKNKNVSTQLPTLNEAHQQIFVQSKKCFVATMCFGQDHHYTNQIRLLKPALLKTSAGRVFVDKYYEYSPKLISYCEKRPSFGRVFLQITKPCLSLLAKITEKLYS